MSRKPPPVPKSTVQGIEWPAIPSLKGRAILALLHQFERSEWLSADEIRAHQFGQLDRVLAHAWETVPFYREWFKGCGIANPKGITPEQWNGLPLIQRQDIQAAAGALHSRAVPRGHGRVSDIYTSGTTGRPIRVLRTELSDLFWAAFTVRDHLWHGRDVTGKLAAIRQYQFVQKDLQTIEVRLAVERDLTDGENEKLREWLVSKLDFPFTATFIFVDEIPRTPSGKYQDFISEIEP